MPKQELNGFVRVDLTPAFAESMVALINSLTTYLDTQRMMHSQTRKPIDNSESMRAYYENCIAGLGILRDTIKSAQAKPLVSP